MQDPTSPPPAQTLEEQIEAFIHAQRLFSDDLRTNSPESSYSADELHQVFVDLEEGLVLRVDPREVVVEDKDDLEAKVARESQQQLITRYFCAVPKTGSAAATDNQSAVCANFVSTNEVADDLLQM